MSSKYVIAEERSKKYTVNESQRDLPRMRISRRMAQEDYTTQASGAIILGIGIILGWFLRDFSEP